tara:strand:+ start:3985 stop:5088 length:1104 start_codon:yes stop_codon:yes gene_type:complete
MNNCFIILAAGQSKRFKSNKPKQYISYKNKYLYEHTIDKVLKSKLFKHILLVVNNKKLIEKIYPKKVKIIKGGKERSDSSFIALKYAKKFKVQNVLIHDAARPNFSINLIKKLLNNLKRNCAVIPYTYSTDSIKYIYKRKVSNLLRSRALLTQTPQAFKFENVYNLAKKNKNKIQDEASLFIEENLKVKFVKGELLNKKITFKTDIYNNMRYGIGFDVHRLVKKRKLYLGGLNIKSDLGTLGHSDGDPVLHAITDSILGACKMGDIGQKFSDKNIKFKNIRSAVLLKKVIKEIEKKKFFINNLDINIITQTPKISKYRNKLISNISNICEISPTKISIKGKTTEKLGLIGKEKAIACEVITSVIKYD